MDASIFFADARQPPDGELRFWATSLVFWISANNNETKKNNENA
jgi:hypothetical protein